MEHLFRAKEKKTLAWVYGDLLHTTPNPSIVPVGWKSLYEHVSVIAETVGKYIGTTDKHDKKVFVGDIVKFIYNGEERIEPVIAHSEIIVYVGRQSNFYAHTIFGHLHEYQPEVIGTIFDNPELLN